MPGGLDNGGAADLTVPADFLQRPRIDILFDKVTGCKLVYVIAGAGYGKTQAVYHYIKKQPDAVVRWLQLTENDNLGAHYWENLTHNVAIDNPDLAFRLRELGFPETLTRFKQFAEILRSAEHRSRKTYLVLDDFHLITSKQALAFAERCAYLQIPGACVIIISRKEPDINAVSLFSRGMAGMVTEDDLRFTDDEIAGYLQQRGVPFVAGHIPQFFDVTKGWVLAIQLLSMVLKRSPKNLKHALATMKQNIFKLLEIEAFNDLPDSVKKALVSISLVSDLPLTPLHEITDDISYIQNSPQLAAFMWYDSFVGDYRIHPLYLEFLQSRHHLLSYDEKTETYRWAANWCSENGFSLSAMNYYAKSRQYKQMLDAFLSYPFRLPPDACLYFLNILNEMNLDFEGNSDHDALLLKYLIIPLLYMGAGELEKAREFSLEMIREWERSDAPIAPYLLYTVHCNLAYIDTYYCTVTHNYNFPELMKKAVEYLRMSTTPVVKVEGAFAVVDVRSFACLVGEGADRQEIDRFLETSRETARYIGETYHKMYYGNDDLIACEIAFFRSQLDLAKTFALSAILKAREMKQYSIEAVAQYYFLRTAIYDGDYTLTKEILRQLRSHLDNPDFWNRQVIYDLITGSFYIHAGLPDMVAPWIALDEKEALPEVRIPVRELIICVRYYLATKKFKQALAILVNSYPRAPHERFQFGELVLSLLLAATRMKTGDPDGAAEEFQKAYKLSFDGEFIMPFIELGRAFHQLAAAVLAREDNVIPEEWLLATERMALVYAKKSSVIINAFKGEKRLPDAVHLTDRERDVLHDLYHGLSREEIAANRYLSVNTVKKILQSIYIKLDANSSIDAIRIAMEKKLVD